ncbi:MAG: hypothetical protein ACR2H1_04230, partial [Limisphaerales bacterium]
MKKHFYSLTCLFSFVAILQGAILPAEKLLPSDTLLFFSIPDYGKLRETTKDSPALQLWRDPSMKAFKDNFLKKFSADVVAPFEKELGIKFADYKGLAQGTIAFGLTQNNLEGKPDQRLGLIFVMDTKGKSSQLATNLSDLKKKWIEAGKEIKSEKIRGLDFTTLITTDEEIGKPWRKLFSTNGTAQATPEAKPKKEPKKMEITIGQVESLLLIGNSTAVIEKIVAHQTGGMVPALATQPVYEANH